MNCQDVQKFSFTYLDGEFDARERGEFEEHLRLCSTCRAQIARDALFKEMSVRHLDEARSQMASKVCPHTLRAKVCAGLDAEERRRRSRAIAVPTALAASVGLLVVSWQTIPGDSAPHAPRGAAASTSDRTASAVAAAPVALPSAAAVVASQPAPAAAARPVAAAAQVQRPAREGAAVAGAGVAGAARGHDLPAPQQAQRPQVHLASTGSAAAAPHADVELGASKEFGSVRTEECVRNMVRSHNAELPAEVTGSPLRIQRYLQSRLPGLGSALPLAQGAGVDLLGARIALVGDHPVVIYRYQAFGVALTVFSRPRAVADTDERGEPHQPGQPRHTGLLLDRSQGLQLLHVVGSERVLTLVSELGAPQMLQLLPPLATM